VGGRCALHRRFQAVDDAFRRGDLSALRAALDDPPDFPNTLLPFELGVGDRPLDYALIWSPAGFVRELLALGADPRAEAADGFPPLISALGTERADRMEILRLLLAHGADPEQRGVNDWTALHYAVVRRDLPAVELLLAHGADPAARTRIDDRTTPLEDAEALGFAEAVAAMRHGPRSSEAGPPRT
jgi:ankyrin repeat protein